MVDEQGNRHLSLKFDVRKFKPEEIKIRSFDENKLEVSAKHEVKSDNHQIYREFRRVCTLPEGVTLESLESHVHPDGILSIEAPLPPEAAEEIAKKEPVRIAIEHEKKDEHAIGDEKKEQVAA
jgi:heat shock protein beta-1